VHEKVEITKHVEDAVLLKYRGLSRTSLMKQSGRKTYFGYRLRAFLVSVVN
jgi:hypothetical protein